MNPEQTAHLQSVIERLDANQRRLLELLDVLQRPAQIGIHRLTASKPIDYDKPSAEARTLSIGIYNPTGIKIYMGIGGGTASAAAEAIPSAPKSLLVLPIPVAQLEIGADPADLVAGDAICFTFRWDTVQPASLGATT